MGLQVQRWLSQMTITSIFQKFQRFGNEFRVFFQRGISKSSSRESSGFEWNQHFKVDFFAAQLCCEIFWMRNAKFEMVAKRHDVEPKKNSLKFMYSMVFTTYISYCPFNSVCNDWLRSHDFSQTFYCGMYFFFSLSIRWFGFLTTTASNSRVRPRLKNLKYRAGWGT